MQFVKTAARVAVALTALTASASAQIAFTGNTLGCFGAACVPVANTFLPTGGGNLTFTGVAFSNTTVAATNSATISSFGTLTFATNGVSNTFSSPFTLQFVFTTPSPLASAPQVIGTVSGSTSGSGSDISYTFGAVTFVPQAFATGQVLQAITVAPGSVNQGVGTISGRVTIRPETVVPEPSTYALLATGLAGLVGVSLRRRASV